MTTKHFRVRKSGRELWTNKNKAGFNPPLSFLQMENQSFRTIEKTELRRVYDALIAGLENTQELLCDHDVRLGRTTRSNRHTAERLESEIKDIKASLEIVKWPYDLD